MNFYGSSWRHHKMDTKAGQKDHGEGCYKFNLTNFSPGFKLDFLFYHTASIFFSISFPQISSFYFFLLFIFFFFWYHFVNFEICFAYVFFSSKSLILEKLLGLPGGLLTWSFLIFQSIKCCYLCKYNIIW